MSRKLAARLLTVLALVFVLGLLPSVSFAAEASGGQGADGATTGGPSVGTGDEGASLDPHG